MRLNLNWRAMSNIENKEMLEPAREKSMLIYKWMQWRAKEIASRKDSEILKEVESCFFDDRWQDAVAWWIADTEADICWDINESDIKREIKAFKKDIKTREKNRGYE